MLRFRQTKRFRSRSRSKPAPKRRLRRFGGKRTKTMSTRSMGSGIGFRSKRLSRRRYKSILWRDTLNKSHYRSVAATLNTTQANASPTVAVIDSADGLPDDFWTTGAGLQALDTGVTPPTFTGDITVRGGKIGLTFMLDGATYPVEVSVWLVKRSNGTPPAFTTGPYGWDPSLVPDFYDDVGKIVMRRKKLLLDESSWNVEFRLPIMKLDQATHNTTNTYLWIWTVQDVSDGGTATVRVNNYHNLSFSADAFEAAA